MITDAGIRLINEQIGKMRAEAQTVSYECEAALLSHANMLALLVTDPNNTVMDVPTCCRGGPILDRAAPIPIEAGESICRTYGYHQIVIMARRVGDGGVEHVTTYGTSKSHCAVAAMMGYDLKYRLMKWDVRHADASERRELPSRTPSDADLLAWGARHGLAGKPVSTLRNAFEDAQQWTDPTRRG